METITDSEVRRCPEGHENPAGRVLCDTCGQELIRAQELQQKQGWRRRWRIGVALGIALLLALGSFVGIRLSRSATVEDGWERFSGEGFAISLPERFQGGDPEEVIEFLRGSGPAGEELAESLEAFPSALSFVAYDAESRSGLPATVNMLRVPRFGTTLQEMSTGYFDELEGTGVDVAEEGLVTIGGEDALRAIYEGQHTGFEDFPTMTGLQYVFETSGTFSILTFTSAPSDFRSLLVEFEESARTFEGIGGEGTD